MYLKILGRRMGQTRWEHCPVCGQCAWVFYTDKQALALLACDRPECAGYGVVFDTFKANPEIWHSPYYFFNPEWHYGGADGP